MVRGCGLCRRLGAFFPTARPVLPMEGWAGRFSPFPVCAWSSLAELEAWKLQCWEVSPAFFREDTRAQGTCVCP